MACSACEDCPRHVNNGGICEEYEYDCPYDIFEHISEESVGNIIKLMNSIRSDFDSIRDILKSDGYELSDFFPSLTYSFEEALDKLDTNAYKRWKNIKNYDNILGIK